ncbi:transcription antitermination factor NusB [Patescibacteria group bacterium]|nr:transcription antitermination factor NusB [Patescibacteria group bacterium]MDE1946570.1 transcription antitermination factor NusB [Patescibacteria group bacterium]MDE2010869.1 transcription antitermination factor NusB [Patescibacteria group bacterium]MDE2232753.1 transcription antitermination factor NusB [Patescibacteria group bacterium]
MANRHLSRSIALQSLFEWDFRGCDKGSISGIVARDMKEFAPGMADSSFVEELLKGIVAKQANLDDVIAKAAPEWPVEKISPVDRNVLRIGLYELLFADRAEVPAKVAINEAIELAKTFGGETSGRFVNGVLGAVYKELGEPGKDAVPSKKKKAEVPYEQMPIQHLGGAVICSRDGKDAYMAFVHDAFGHWTLSKGKIPEGTDPKDGTVAKVKEEIGLEVAIKADLGQNEYIANDPEIGKIRKQVHYYLAESPFVKLKLAKKPGLNDAKWFKLADIMDLNFYDDILPIVTKAVTIFSKSE